MGRRKVETSGKTHWGLAGLAAGPFVSCLFPALLLQLSASSVTKQSICLSWGPKCFSSGGCFARAQLVLQHASFLPFLFPLIDKLTQDICPNVKIEIWQFFGLHDLRKIGTMLTHGRKKSQTFLRVMMRMTSAFAVYTIIISAREFAQFSRGRVVACRRNSSGTLGRKRHIRTGFYCWFSYDRGIAEIIYSLQIENRSLRAASI